MTRCRRAGALVTVLLGVLALTGSAGATGAGGAAVTSRETPTSLGAIRCCRTEPT